jgi:hypothetical protein
MIWILALTGVLAGSAYAATAPKGTVTVTAKGYPLICGHATGLVKVVFPAAVALPKKIAPSAVTVNGHAASSVTIAKHTISVIVPRNPGITCLSIVMGKLTIAFAPRAHVERRTARTATVLRATQRFAARVTLVS